VFDAAREPLAPEAAGWVFRSDAPATPPAAPIAAPRLSGSLTARIDRLLSPVALALTIALAPLRSVAGPRSRR
jgi:hypothetical protein